MEDTLSCTQLPLEEQDIRSTEAVRIKEKVKNLDYISSFKVENLDYISSPFQIAHLPDATQLQLLTDSK